MVKIAFKPYYYYENEKAHEPVGVLTFFRFVLLCFIINNSVEKEFTVQ